MHKSNNKVSCIKRPKHWHGKNKPWIYFERFVVSTCHNNIEELLPKPVSEQYQFIDKDHEHVLGRQTLQPEQFKVFSFPGQPGRYRRCQTQARPELPSQYLVRSCEIGSSFNN